MPRPDLLRVALLASALLLPGCSKEEPPPPPPPPPPPKAEVKPETVAEIMARLPVSVDKRIHMDDSERPNTGDAEKDAQRLETILKFFDAMVNGKAEVVRPMLHPSDQGTLDAMVKDGQWNRASKGITKVDLGCAGDKVLAIYLIENRFDAQLWELVDVEGSPQFKAYPQLPGMMERLQGTKADPRIQQWMKIVKDFMQKGGEPDESPDIPQQDRSVAGEGGSGSSAPSSAPGPSGPRPAGKP